MVDNKGNWEFSFFQKKYNPNEEANIKLSMKPDNGFNPKNVHNYINKTLSKEEKILIKKNQGTKIKSVEELILQNYLKKNEQIYKMDIQNIQKYGSKAQPISMNGKIHLLFKILEEQLDKDNKDNIVNIYFKLMENEVELNEKIKTEYTILKDLLNLIIGKLK